MALQLLPARLLAVIAFAGPKTHWIPVKTCEPVKEVLWAEAKDDPLPAKKLQVPEEPPDK
ncbi:hypothetical protein EBX31_11330 [bacterium]|nr:hypothetical protein [bacterium]